MGLRDPVSSLSHLFMAAWAAYATLILIQRMPAVGWRRPAVAVYGLSMVAVYLASGAFHATTSPWRGLQHLDQSAIYLLIAGTNTPIIVGLLGRRGRWLLGAMWGLVAVGVTFQWALAAPPHAVIVGVCLGLGWMGFLPVIHYYRAVGWRAVNWLWAAGLTYTLGGVVEFTDWPVLAASPVLVGSHEVFHVLVMAGSVLFYVFIARYVVAYRPAPAGRPVPRPRRTDSARPSAYPCRPAPAGRVSRRSP